MSAQSENPVLETIGAITDAALDAPTCRQTRCS